MKKIIMAVIDKKISKEIDTQSKIIKLVQYREGILEILDSKEKIDEIYIEEKLPGIISIEKLIKIIKKKNNKVKIVFFLENEEDDKIKKLKNIGIKEIRIKGYKKEEKKKEKVDNFKIKKNKIEKNRYTLKKEIRNKKNNNKNNKKINNKKNKIIIISGKNKTGKTTIMNLLIIYLKNLNKKILIININKKIEKNYLNNINKNIKEKNKNILTINKYKKNKNTGIKYFYKINQFNNFINLNFYKIFKNYDYILVENNSKEIYFNKPPKVKNIIKNIVVIDDVSLGKEDLQEYFNIQNNNIRKFKNSLHIIYNKYKISSINIKILKRCLLPNTKIDYILNYRKYLKYNQKIIDRKNINFFMMKKVKKLLE